MKDFLMATSLTRNEVEDAEAGDNTPKETVADAPLNGQGLPICYFTTLLLLFYYICKFFRSSLYTRQLLCGANSKPRIL